MKRVAISQSNYIPWKGYFDLIASVDEFILFDDVQFTKRDWRNRNVIVTPQGLHWLTIPVKVKGRYLQTICDTETTGNEWRAAHWASLKQNYSKAPCFDLGAGTFERLYLDSDERMLSRVNFVFLRAVCQFLGINTKLSWSIDYGGAQGDNKTERLLNICRAAGATHYLSGPAAQAYIDTTAFARATVVLDYMDYANYPPYKQLYGGFEHAVTVLDLIFNTGHEAPLYLKRASLAESSNDSR